MSSSDTAVERDELCAAAAFRDVPRRVRRPAAQQCPDRVEWAFTTPVATPGSVPIDAPTPTDRRTP